MWRINLLMSVLVLVIFNQWGHGPQYGNAIN